MFRSVRTEDQEQILWGKTMYRLTLKEDRREARPQTFEVERKRPIPPGDFPVKLDGDPAISVYKA
jgi:hypothetical protein